MFGAADSMKQECALSPRAAAAVIQNMAAELTRLRAALAEAQRTAQLREDERDAANAALRAAHERSQDMGRRGDEWLSAAQKAERQLAEARALLLEVASAGIEHSTRDYVLLQLPTVTWDAIETAVEKKP